MPTDPSTALTADYKYSTVSKLIWGPADSLKFGVYSIVAAYQGLDVSEDSDFKNYRNSFFANIRYDA